MQHLRADLSDSIKDYRKEGVLSSIWQGRGRVVVATHTPTSVSLALKIFDLEKCTEDFDLIQHEARMLREVRHPNLCCLVGSLSVGQEAWLLLPRLLCSVADLLHSQYTFGLPELAIAVVARDILLALQYLHARGIIHRNVQARHVLVSPCGRAVLSGLRHSVYHRQSEGGRHTLHCYPRNPRSLLNWASPEMLHQDLRGYSFPTDVYSLGLMVCELGNAEQPYQDLPPTLMMVQKLRGLVPFLHDASNMDEDDCSDGGKGSRNSLTSNGGLHLSGGGGISNGSGDDGKLAAQQQRHFTAAAHQFVRRTLALEPPRRPSVQELLNSDTFIRQARKAANSSLVALLHLKDMNQALKDDGLTRELENQLAQATIDDTSWTFETP